MLVELGLVEQRLKAVHEVLDGATVVDVAERYGVVRQTVHTWLKNYPTNGMPGLVDKTSKPWTKIPGQSWRCPGLLPFWADVYRACYRVSPVEEPIS